MSGSTTPLAGSPPYANVFPERIFIGSDLGVQKNFYIPLILENMLSNSKISFYSGFTSWINGKDKKNSMLDTSNIAIVALFNGNPLAAGTEITGGTPAYSRQSITMVAASSGTIVVTADIVFDVPNGATVNYVAFYDSGGTNILGTDDITEEIFDAQGVYTLDSCTFGI